jgi:hypothetical protein
MLKRCALVVLACTGLAQAAPVKIESQAATFVYEFLSTSNASDIYGGNTAAARNILAVNESSGTHDMRSILKFDLTGITLDPGEQAIVGLYVRSAAFGSGTPSSSYAPVVGIHALQTTPSWSEAASWSNSPDIAGSALDSVTVSSIDHYIEFDVTDQVQAWLANPSSNNGFGLVQAARVYDPTAPSPYPPYTPGLEVGVFFRGAGWTTPGERPYLAVVPEPASLAFVVTGALLLKRRRRI